MSFGALSLLSIAIAAVAVLRLRPSLCIFAGNQIGVLRALDHVEQFGQPRSQGFLPPSVFSLENLAVARTLFLGSTLLLAAAVLWPAPRRQQRERLPALPRFILWGLLAYFAALIFSQKTILTNAYTDPDRVLYGLNLSGGHAFLAAIFLYEMARRALTGELSRPRAFGAVLLLFLCTDYLKGSTGLATGFLVVAAFLILGGEPRPLRRWASLGAAVAALVLISITVRGVRATLWQEGSQSISSLQETLSNEEERVSRTGEGLEIFGNGVQYAAHVLECVELYEAGISREWRSVYLPALYTLQPKFVMILLDLERPKEAAWELADYYIHGGGIYVLGELYWNGGFLCAFTVFAALLAFCFFCDTRWQTSFVWLLLVCEFAPNTLQGIGYGFAQVSRGIFNGLIALGCYFVWRRLRRPSLRESHA